MVNQQLHRSDRHRIIGGVCGGLAESFGGSPWLYRLAFIAGTIITHGALIILYPALWIFLPSQSRLDHRYVESGAGTIGRLPAAGDVSAEPYRRTNEVTGSAPAAGGSKPMDKIQDELLRMSDGAVDAYQRWRERRTGTRPQSSTDVIKPETEVVDATGTTDHAAETIDEAGHDAGKTGSTGARETPQ